MIHAVKNTLETSPHIYRLHPEKNNENDKSKTMTAKGENK